MIKKERSTSFGCALSNLFQPTCCGAFTGLKKALERRTLQCHFDQFRAYCCWRRSANWCFERPLNCRPHTHARTNMHTSAHTRTQAHAYIHTRTKTRTQARIRTHTQTHPTGGWRFRLRRDRWNSKPNTMTTQSSYMLRPAAARKCVYFCHK